MKIIDSNILIYAANDAAVEQAVCQRWLDKAFQGDEEIGFNWIAITGFLRLVTHPKVFAAPLSPDRRSSKCSNG